MNQYWLPILFTLLAWWISTGVVLILNRQTDRNRHVIFTLASVLSIACVYGLFESSKGTTVAHAYLVFTQALIIWAWCEMSYFMGYITGTRKEPCPGNASNLERFILAVKTSIHHELLVMCIGLFLIIFLWNMPNKVGVLTFIILWLMRWSAKLNIFLGVSNLNKEWIPKQLNYIHSYTRHKPINYLFPFSITMASVCLAWLVFIATSDSATNFESIGYTLLGTLLSLAILEHWVLLLPINDSALWKWAIRTKRTHTTKKELQVTGASRLNKKIYIQN